MFRGSGPVCVIASLVLLIAGGLSGGDPAVAGSLETPQTHTHAHSHGGRLHHHAHAHAQPAPLAEPLGRVDRARGCDEPAAADEHHCCEEHHCECLPAEFVVLRHRGPTVAPAVAAIPPERHRGAGHASPNRTPPPCASGRPPDHLGYVRTVVLLT